MLLNSLTQKLWQPVAAHRLALYRILFGSLMMMLIGRYFIYGWIDKYFIQPEFHFKYYGFSWVPVLEPTGMYILFACMGVLALCITLGLIYRVAIILFFILFSWFHLIDTTIYLNHYYLISLLAGILCFLPANRVWSLDRYYKLFRTNKNFQNESIPQWCLSILQFQIVIVYFFGGVAKLHPDWILEARPLLIWLQARTDTAIIGPILAYKATAYLVAWAGMLFDLAVPFLLYGRRTRWVGLALALVFHLATLMLFRIGMFPWIMLASLSLFFEQRWLLLILHKFNLYNIPPVLPERDRPSTSELRSKSRQHTTILAGLVFYCLIQIALPLRHWLYPGNYYWHEQGFRFAWHIMLIEKKGFLTFELEDRLSGSRWIVDPARSLTPYQSMMMATQPDMILQMAHQIARTQSQPVRIYAKSHVSLNGRPARLLINPEVDLSRVKDGYAAYDWVLAGP